jgi:1-acyl-sn-glycerol-3-phosphate acyltransferase
VKKKHLLGGEIPAILALVVLMFTTILCFIPIFFFGLIKLIPYQPLRNRCTINIDAVATRWCDMNNRYINRHKLSKFQCSGFENIPSQNWYLVVANHQSWLDIVVLQQVLNRKIPILKFFIKDQLKWIPCLGFAWWAMGCPFMKRYSKSYLAKKPHKKGKDVEATLKAIETFKKTPASIMNFVEGTRFTADKQIEQQSPYQHFLKPKAGGIGFVIAAMNKHINSLLDVTIIYPDEHHSLWDFLCKRIKLIKVHVRELPIPAEFREPNATDNPDTEIKFREWLNEQWAEKDRIAKELK